MRKLTGSTRVAFSLATCGAFVNSAPSRLALEEGVTDVAKDQPVAEATVVATSDENLPVKPVKTEGRLDDATLRSITSFADLEQHGQVLVDAESVLGTGWERVDDDVAAKEALVDVPLVIVDWDFSIGEFYNENGTLGQFVTMFVLTEDGRRQIITDGSTGLAKELYEYSYDEDGAQIRPMRNLYLRKGFRKSEYFIDAKSKKPVPRGWNGPKEPAATFYLNV